MIDLVTQSQSQRVFDLEAQYLAPGTQSVALFSKLCMDRGEGGDGPARSPGVLGRVPRQDGWRAAPLVGKLQAWARSARARRLLQSVRVVRPLRVREILPVLPLALRRLPALQDRAR